MEQKIILDIIESVEPKLWVMLAKIGIAGVLVLILKSKMESISSYVMFALNKELGKNTKVRVRGVDGVITDYNIRWIVVTVSNGVMLIPMVRWKYEQFTVLYNGQNRREGDDNG